MRLWQRSLWLSIGTLACVVPALARETTVKGAVSSGYDFRDRSYEQSRTGAGSDDGDTRKLSIGPMITVSSRGVYDTLDVSYSPQVAYNFVTEDSNLDHQFTLNNVRSLASNWSLTLADSFVMTDDSGQSSSSPSPGTIAGGQIGQIGQGGIRPSTTDTLSRDLNGRRFWTNTASLRTDYAFSQETSLGSGYSYNVLRNESGGGDSGTGNYQEYDKHSLFAQLSHAFDPHWQSNLDLNYTRGIYDNTQDAVGQTTGGTTPDLNEYGGEIGLKYVDSTQDGFPFTYSLSQTKYDENTRRDSTSHQWSIGWEHFFDAQTKFSVGGGPSYAESEGLDGTWGYNAYATYSKQYQHATYAVLLGKRYETQNFTGTDNSGLTDTYSAEARMTYRYTQYLDFDLFGRYNLESNIDPQGQYRTVAVGGGSGQETGTGDISYDTTTYELGAGVSYTFERWYTAGFRYVYFVSDGDLDSDRYTDHQVVLTLTASRDLWRW